MAGTLPTDWSARLAAAGRASLLSLVEEHLRAFGEREALQALRHPFCSTEVVELVLGDRRFAALASVRKAAALHPATPRPDALRCVEDLGWRDLLDVSREARTPAPVRRAASLKILDRLPRLALGERLTLARLADRPVLRALLEDVDPRVVAALLTNPRLVPEDLVAWVATGRPAAESLRMVGGDARWTERREIRGALLRCASTPRGVALALLSRCSRGELADLLEDPGADRLLVACAANLLDSEAPPD